MIAAEKFEQLKAFYLFLAPSLSEKSWDICENVLTVRTLKKGEMILKEGTVCNHVSFINRGLGRMYYNTDGKEKVVCFFNENMYTCDYQSFLTRQPGFLNIQALETTEVIETSYENLQMLYRDVPEANFLGRMIAEQLYIKMNEGNLSAMCDSLEQRYATLQREQPWLIQKVPQYMIASYLGITPEALSRVKGRMNKKRKAPALVLA